MKLLRQQLKLPDLHISKYIKKNDIRWLLFLLIPLVIGLIVHFVVPLAFVINANPFIQLKYNNEKIEIQLNTVRSLSLLNSEIIRIKMQATETLRNFLIHIFGQDSSYISMVNDQIFLNNAYQFANQFINNSQNATNIQNRSMWFAQGKQNTSQFDFRQQLVYGFYLNLQPFIRSQFLSQAGKSAVNRITTTVNFFGSDLYFQYPSEFNPIYLNLNESSYDKYFNQTMLNYKMSNGTYQYMIFTEKHQELNQNIQLVICNIIYSYDLPMGVSCFHMQLQSIAKQITQSLTIPNVQYSTTSYYLLTPIYPIFSLQLNTTINQPQIIFNFTDKNSSKISFPNNTFFKLPSMVPPSLYAPNSSYVVNYTYFIAYQTSTLIYIQVPIHIYSYQQKKQTIMFLLLQYNFSESAFDLASKYNQILKDLSIPSTIVIIVSTVISLVLLKFLLNNLDDQIFKVNQKCEFLLHGDIDLKIQQYQNTEQLKNVYKNLRIINCLHKFSTQEYFLSNQQQEQQKIIKYFKVLQIFQQINYSTDIVYQNIADSYLKIKDLNKSIEYYEKGYENLIKQVQGMFGFQFEQILGFKQKQNGNGKKFSKKYRRYQLKIIGRLFKLIYVYYLKLFRQPQIKFYKQNVSLQEKEKEISNNEQNSLQKLKTFRKLKKHLNIFKKLTSFPSNFITSETLYTLLIQSMLQISQKKFKESRILLKKFQKFIIQYQNDYQQQIQQNFNKMDSPIKNYQQMKHNLSNYCRIHPNILWSLYYFVMGKYIQNQPIEGRERERQRDVDKMLYYYSKAIETNYYSIDVHVKILDAFIKIAKQYNVPIRKIERQITSLIIFKQNFPLYHIKGINTTQRLKPLQTFKLNNSLGYCGLQKQVLFIFDCSNKWLINLQQFRQWQKNTRQISLNIFQYLNQRDRISILKVNSNIYVQTCCNLIYKENNESLILRELSNVVKLKYMAGKCEVIKGINIAVNRVKQLNEQKIIVVFLKEDKQNQKQRMKKMNKKKSTMKISLVQIQKQQGNTKKSSNKKRQNTQISPFHKKSIYSNVSHHNSNNLLFPSFQQQPNINIEQQTVSQNQLLYNSFYEYYKNLKDQLLSILLNKQIYNLKIILVVQNSENFIKKFNLSEINTILHQEFRIRQNNNNNLLLICDKQKQNKIDYERIFKKKINLLQQNGNNMSTFLNMF